MHLKACVFESGLHITRRIKRYIGCIPGAFVSHVYELYKRFSQGCNAYEISPLANEAKSLSYMHMRKVAI
jgi:hypothetical protein